MDVLDFWQPNIRRQDFDFQLFSDPFANELFDFITLCHSIRYWNDKKVEAKRMARQAKKSGWEDEARLADTREHRARFLAAEKLWTMAGLASSNAENEFVRSAVLETGLQMTLNSHERANFNPFALEKFSGDGSIRN